MLTLLNSLPVLDRVFDDVMRDPFGFAPAQAFGRGVDVHATDDALSIAFDVPGVRADGVSVEIENNVLRVQAERKPRHNQAQGAATYSWAYTLPDGYDSEAMKASLSDGVLTVEIPKHPKAKPRKIQVLSGGSEPKQIGSAEAPEKETA